MDGRTPQATALTPDARQSGPDPLGAPSALKFADGTENVHLEFSGRRRGVDALGQRDERHAQRLEIVEQGDQVFEAPSETVETPADEHVESSFVSRA